MEQTDSEDATSRGVNAAQPLVTVVMPCFNQCDFVAESIEGVLRQTWQNLELIVVDDASTDGSREIIQRFSEQDSRMRLILHDQNLGPGKSRNDAIGVARGEYMAFCDADDVWMPERLEVSLQAMCAHPEVGLIYSNSTIIDEQGAPTGENFSRRHELPAEHSGNVFKQLCDHNFINMPTVVIRRSCVPDSALFDEDIRCGEDWWGWLNLASQHKFLYIERELVRYRIHPNSTAIVNARRYCIDRVKISARLLRRYPEMSAWLQSQVIYQAAMSLSALGRRRAARRLFWMATLRCLWNWRPVMRLLIEPETRLDIFLRRLLRLRDDPLQEAIKVQKGQTKFRSGPSRVQRESM